jgi:hypothetical protein
MTRLLATSSAIVALTGCVVVADNDPQPPPPPPPVFVNHVPVVVDAAAYVYWDDYNYDDIWYFQSTVDDMDGVYDVNQVWADVYDERSGTLIDSFELYPSQDPVTWWSDWLGSSTSLDPCYGGYTVDFTVYDAIGDFSVSTVWADTY